MIGAKRKCCVVVLVPIIIGGNAAGHGNCKEPKDKQMTTVRAQDIPKTVRIIGRLGEPLGSLLTIRGKWIRPGIQMKDPSLMFHVDLVNGKEAEARIELHILQVTTILPLHKGGRKGKPGKSWDWRFDWEGSEPSPTPMKGEKWEMMGVETGFFETYSEDAWREIGSTVPQTPPCMDGFATRFEYIAVRRVK